MSEREQIVEVLNRLYYYTDHFMWDSLKQKIFTEMVDVDTTSLGDPTPVRITADALCQKWEGGLKDLDAVHHQAGNYIIDLEGNTAKAKAYAIASHYKKDTVGENTRTFVGSYDFKLSKTDSGWRINAFKFNLKYMSGNLELK